MSSDKLENIYKLLTEHNFDANKNVPDEFKCGKCRKILIDACQTRCGCRFCRSCVDEMMNNGCQFCPGITSDCKTELLSTVQLDYRANKQISKLIMKCPEEMCSYECELLEMSEHLRICGKKSVKCSFYENGCKRRKIANEKLIEPVQLENYNHNKTLIENIKNEVEELREKKFINHKKINKLKDEKLESINAEMEIMKKEKLEMENRLKNVEEMFNVEITKLKSEHKKEIQSINDEIRLEMMEVCKQTMDKSIMQMGIIQKINQLERIVENQMKVIFEMMIDNVDKCRTKLFQEIWSDYFYARICPYKLRLRIYLSNELWIRLCVFDDMMNLPFPFTADVTIKITNKNKREVSKSITKYCQIEKPELFSFNASDKFIYPHSELIKSGILESNCIIVECCVELKY